MADRDGFHKHMDDAAKGLKELRLLNKKKSRYELVGWKVLAFMQQSGQHFCSK